MMVNEVKIVYQLSKGGKYVSIGACGKIFTGALSFVFQKLYSPCLNFTV